MARDVANASYLDVACCNAGSKKLKHFSKISKMRQGSCSVINMSVRAKSTMLRSYLRT